MQQNTRYVEVKLGIGGYQPTDAKTVCKSGYGECKALSNYMYSLLKFAGIKSYPALVAAGYNNIPIFKDFPNFNQFNHVIVCLPFHNDTIWLECTNQKVPFGFIGDFADDRDVLLITEDGGRFAHTKKYEAENNLRKCTGYFNIDSTGTTSCTIKTSYQGLQYDHVFEFLCSNFDEQKKWLYSNSTLPSSQITGFSIINSKSMIPNATINESIISRNYCSFSGKYMILPLDVINAQQPIQKMLKTRYSDVIINRSYIDYDSLLYQIPGNYKYESIPSGTTINSDFGKYSTSISVKGDKIIFSRKLTIIEGRYKPSSYKDIYEFMLAVSKADNVKVFLTKNL